MSFRFSTALLLISLAAFSSALAMQKDSGTLDCSSDLEKIKTAFESRYSVKQMQTVRAKVVAAVNVAEKAEFLSLQKKFNSLPHDTPDNINTRFELQKRARVLVRTAVSRAGYRILNPVEPSPYDALIGTKVSADDGYNEYSIELRSLLVEKNPLPHLTIWMHRNDPKHNPWSIITVGLTDTEQTDYVSFRKSGGERVVLSKIEFFKSLLPSNCP